MTAGTINSKLLKMQVAADGATPVTITCQTNAELTINNEVFDVTCKDSGQWKEVLPGMTSASISGELYVSYDAANGHDELMTLALAQTRVNWIFGTGVSGDTKLSGDGYFTSNGITSSGNNEGVTMSYEITVSGAVTQGTFS
jgi:predicted secreted protein